MKPLAHSEPSVRLALVGAGLIGRRHLALMAAEPGCQVVAVADPAPGTRELAAAAGACHYNSHIELLNGERPDGVVVAAPTPLHVLIGVDCVRQGIPLLVEKPFADTVAAGLALAEAAATARTPIAVGHHRRFDPAVAAARDLLAGGEIGDLVGISGVWAVRKPASYFRVAWRRLPGGGPVLLNLIHNIDLLRHCCGEVESVYAEVSSRQRHLKVEDSGAVLLRFAGGALATIAFSDAAPSPWSWERATADNPEIPASGENCYRFFGPEGSFEFPNILVWRRAPGGEPGWSRRITSNSPRFGS